MASKRRKTFYQNEKQETTEIGRPSPQVSWWVGGELVDSSDEAVSERKVRNTLETNPVGRHLHGLPVTCRAVNNRILQPLSTTVNLKLYLKPIEVKLIGDKRGLKAGTPHQIKCRVAGSTPPPVITWHKRGHVIQGPTQISISSDGNITTSTLTFTPEIDDLGAKLTCIASNPHLPTALLNDSWILDVLYPPQVSVRLGANLNGSSIREGVDVYFECTIDANPRITRVIWNRAGRSIINDPSGGVIVSNQTLVLQSVSRSSAGYYSCGAANSQGETHSSPFLLHVKYEPECGDRQQKVYGAARLEEVLVECEVDANPAPSEFRWWFNNSSVRRRPLETFNWTKGYSVAAYTPTSETDYGTLLCSATNQLGTQAVPCVFHIVPAGKPDTPQNCTVTNRSMSWIQVNCVRGFDGGLPQEIAAEISHNGRIILNLTSGAGALFHISGLDPGNEYFVTIYSTNAKGKSDPTNLIVTTLGQSQQPHRRITDGPMAVLEPVVWVSGSVAIACSLFAALAVISVLLFRRLRRTPADNCGDTFEAITKTSVMTVSMPVSTLEDERNPDVVPHSNGDTDVSNVRNTLISTDFSSDSLIPWNSRLGSSIDSAANNLNLQGNTSLDAISSELPLAPYGDLSVWQKACDQPWVLRAPLRQNAGTQTITYPHKESAV